MTGGTQYKRKISVKDYNHILDNQKIRSNTHDIMYITNMEEFAAAKAGAKPLVIDFTATWCPPCKRIGPIYEGLVASYPMLEMKKVDVDAAADVSGACEI